MPPRYNVHYSALLEMRSVRFVVGRIEDIQEITYARSAFRGLNGSLKMKVQELNASGTLKDARAHLGHFMTVTGGSRWRDVKPMLPSADVKLLKKLRLKDSFDDVHARLGNHMLMIVQIRTDDQV